MENEVQSNILPQPTPQTLVSQSTNRSKVLLFILLELLIVAGSALIGIQIGKNKVLNQQPIAVQQTASPTQVVVNPTVLPTTNTTVDWKTYSSEKYSFEIKYHPESNPNEFIGTNEVGQFTYLFLVKFGTNPIKSLYGYELRVSQMTPDYRGELVGHATDRIDSEEETVINNNTWKKINYKIFVTTDYIPFTMAITDHGGYSFAISSSALDIDQILSTFKFTN